MRAEKLLRRIPTPHVAFGVNFTALAWRKYQGLACQFVALDDLHRRDTTTKKEYLDYLLAHKLTMVRPELASRRVSLTVTGMRNGCFSDTFGLALVRRFVSGVNGETEFVVGLPDETANLMLYLNNGIEVVNGSLTTYLRTPFADRVYLGSPPVNDRGYAYFRFGGRTKYFPGFVAGECFAAVAPENLMNPAMGQTGPTALNLFREKPPLTAVVTFCPPATLVVQ
ncbi:hypothetical protein A2291_00785 [candidate division WOR-1 bacterium RIFOXYB2_FULL_42_35]|uniref:Uncharacterized protein n=1 Tax=candidate division WOR-1 bacterium RIFOXYC2_FULL_41_25 TaxID=1802586 RepID=A0A1F4TLT1_UNCSA|nr:MAG: hypothetical protein A2247_05770 [candidate division WOR-1 bacterium RIFOXYA2_FULL_41_14]OGC23593.1 MAG: hypothetical protein A2291_00785 [candidate division WOR-1 bacterium RIFOXYB2_FULL_42_35]OGC33557.1 MAG: hypothetical protein A2462_02600 [candidate division WOR-1 bacterium RIFOXYC2_FULL_41_25]